MLLLRALSGIEGEFEGERVAQVSRDWRPSADDGKRFARYELRGTFHVLLLRAISSIEGEFEGERAAGLRRGWRPSADFFLR